MINLNQIARISGQPLTAARRKNALSVIASLERFGAQAGLDQPHRLAQYLAQLFHESGAFQYDQELASGAAYEGRKDLGNTQPGDGKRFKGRGPIQLTGRANYRAFTKWARKLDPACPDFEKEPHLINTDPWEGLTAIWYWEEGNPDPKGRSLNHYADRNDIEMITRRINGGLNGYADRLNWYDRVALVLLGFARNDVFGFQAFAQKARLYTGMIDRVSGPQTRAALHRALVAQTPKAEQAKEIAAAPVVEKQEVVPVAVEQEVKQKTNWLTGLLSLLTGASGVIAWAKDADWQTLAIVGGGGAVTVGAALFAGEWIVRRIKAIKAEVEA